MVCDKSGRKMPRHYWLGSVFSLIPSILFLNVVGWTILLVFIQVKSAPIADTAIIPTVHDFFPKIEADLSSLKWGHGINSRLQLNHSLHGKDMMVEADVSLGTLSGDKETVLPIMAHPPSKSSDLSLKEFLETLLISNFTKGIKLDFKEIGVLEKSLQTIESSFKKIRAVPLWLNADIIAGPVNATTLPVNAGQFLNLTKYYFPGAVLSVGWTTRFGPDITKWPPQFINDGRYTQFHVEEMRDALLEAEIRQPLTFPVRAGLLTTDSGAITWLLNQFEESTLTIWSGPYDRVDVPKLVEFIDKVGKRRVYLDVPNGLLCEIRHFNED